MTSVLRNSIVGTMFVASVAATAAAQATPPAALSSLEVQRLVASGEPAASAKLSAHFDALADQYTAAATDHDAMARGYKGTRNQAMATSLIAHCERLAKLDRESASILQELSAYHAKLAGGLTASAPTGGARFEAGEGALVPSVNEVNALIAKATTAADHRALAAYYTTVAKQYAAAENEHTAMVGAYQGSRVTMGASHCERLAKLAREEAKEANEAAALHTKMADSVR